MSATQTGTPTACLCARCMAHANGLGPGPYTVEQFTLISPPITSVTPDPVSSDPDVIAAREAVTQARSIADVADALWEQAVADHRTAAMISGRDPHRRDFNGQPTGDVDPAVFAARRQVPELREAEATALERRTAAWAAHAKANAQERTAIFAAQQAQINHDRQTPADRPVPRKRGWL